MRYRPEIDGLRALAIVPVVLYHFRPPWLPGGFVGVDVFFVISGYLISSLILREHAEGTFALSHFWTRRVRRIMPALLLMVFTTLIGGYFLIFDAEWPSLGWQGLSTLLLSANLYVWHLTDSYWGPAASGLPLLHNWSLSVEEQFYLIYPLVLLLCLSWFPRRLLLFLTALFAGSLVISITSTSSNPGIAFYGLPARAWELAGGCLLAAWAHQETPRGSQAPPIRPWVQHGLALLGVALICFSWFFVSERNFPGYQALIPVVGSMLAIRYSAGAASPAVALLSFGPLRYIGLVSYSLYLWHWPVIVLGRAAQVRWNVPDVAYLGLIPVLAIAAFYAVELPGRRTNKIVTPVIGGACLVAILSAALIQANPKHDLSAFAPTVWLGAAYDVAPELKQPDFVRIRMEGISQTTREPRYSAAFEQDGIVKQYGHEQIDVFVEGNSHALMWAPIIDEICRESQLTVAFYIADGVPPFPGVPVRRPTASTFTQDQWMTFETRRSDLVKDRHPRIIVVASRWSAWTPDADADRFVETAGSQGSKLLIIGDPPELAIGDINAAKYVAATSARTIKAHGLGRQSRALEQLRSILETCRCGETLDVTDLYLAGGDRVRVRDQNSVFYIDDDHLSVAGARVAKERIRNKILGLLGMR